MIDTSTEFGQRVAHRLGAERIIWLTTTDARGGPQPRPVWFLWDGETILIFSRPNMAKIRHIGRNPRVSLNLDGDGRGGDIIVITGEAYVDHEAPPANQIPAYVEKYRPGFERLNMTPSEFARTYSVPIRVIPGHLRGH